MPERPIAILGGGIMGLTAAVLLRVMGYKAVIYAAQRADFDPNGPRRPDFATLHAAASILPHSVASPALARWTGVSQSFFRVLGYQASSGVRTQTHYEVFEDPIDSLPPYAGAVDQFERLEGDALTSAPRRAAAQAIHGWRFDAFFCEAPEYVHYLQTLYEALGGQWGEAQGSLAEYLSANHDIFVNCLGMHAPPFLARVWADNRFADAPGADFEPLTDPFGVKLIRGLYLRLDMKRILTGDRNRLFSYNYKPLSEVYRTAKGLPADVYCYQRSDGWLLGGSRQEGRLDADGRWIGETTVGDEVSFARTGGEGTLAVPAPVLRLNADILRHMTGGDLDLEQLVRDDPGMVSPGEGYRFVRDSETDSIRLSASQVDFAGARKYVLHNYGHGGSGYTLSWGCALDVLRLVNGLTGRPPRERGPRFSTHHTAMGVMLGDLAERLVGN